MTRTDLAIAAAVFMLALAAVAVFGLLVQVPQIDMVFGGFTP